MPQVRLKLAAVAFVVQVCPVESGGLVPEETLYCIRQRWCGAEEQWELVFTPFSHGIN
jgi:hypothetical protein